MNKDLSTSEDEIKGFLDNHTEVTLFDGTPENPTQIAVELATKLYQEMDCDGNPAAVFYLKQSHQGELVSTAIKKI